MAVRESPALRLHCMAKNAKIGVVGTGRMGSNMAKRLREVGYPISALYDVQPASAKATAQETGGEATASLARVSELSDIILTVVSDDAAMERIFATAGDSLLQGCAGDHAVYFSAEHAAKDSGIALSLARDVGLALPLAGASYSQYDLMKSLGLGALDKSGVSELTFLSRHGQRL
jgi:3-hydroxyisobutyrate dehydrogenase-like beta-hydroxyacid dehydrogenase